MHDVDVVRLVRRIGRCRHLAGCGCQEETSVSHRGPLSGRWYGSESSRRQVDRDRRAPQSPGGISAAGMPKTMPSLFSLTMPPQSASGGWTPRPRKDSADRNSTMKDEAQAQLGHQRRQRVGQDFPEDDPAMPSPRSLAASTKSITLISTATARDRRKTRVESSSPSQGSASGIGRQYRQDHEGEDQRGDRHKKIDKRDSS